MEVFIHNVSGIIGTIFLIAQIYNTIDMHLHMHKKDQNDATVRSLICGIMVIYVVMIDRFLGNMLI